MREGRKGKISAGRSFVVSANLVGGGDKQTAQQPQAILMVMEDGNLLLLQSSFYTCLSKSIKQPSTSSS